MVIAISSISVGLWKNRHVSKELLGVKHAACWHRAFTEDDADKENYCNVRKWRRRKGGFLGPRKQAILHRVGVLKVINEKEEDGVQESENEDGKSSLGVGSTVVTFASLEKSVEATETVLKEMSEDEAKLNENQLMNLVEDENLLRKVLRANDADEALALISIESRNKSRMISSAECSALILAALAQNNVDLAFSILNSMRNSMLKRRVVGKEEQKAGNNYVSGWSWAQPDVHTYAALIRGLAASLRVAEAIQTLSDACRRGLPPSDEVAFGKVVRCPTCKIALAVVQPHQGIQVVPCSTCRYQYELMSGDVIKSESEMISSDISIIQKGLQALKLMKLPSSAAVHSLVVRAPNGMARTHRFATENADVPAQIGERVTVVSAAPTDAGRSFGLLRISGRSPGRQPSEPMSIMNHVTSLLMNLLRAPPKSGSGAAFDGSVIIPGAILLATSNAATAFLDPTLPRSIAFGVAAAVTLGGVANKVLLPRLSKLPERTVGAISIRQQLLEQHELLESRVQDLSKSAADDVRNLARMCQLQNKMESVGEDAYDARIERLQKAKQETDARLGSKLELIDSYAKVMSMIEIEVEMNSDILSRAGRDGSNMAEYIERLMEVEDMEKQWKVQAEANDEVEKLLSSL